MLYNHSTSNIQSLIEHAKKHAISYTIDPQQREARAITKHSPATQNEVPLVVLFPKSTGQASVILKACNERRIAVTSFSGGTSFGGALSATRGGICVSFERMKAIIALHEDDMDVVVQPGLGWVELNEQLKDKGLFFPVDPAPGASIGGMIAMSCSGTNAYRYGTMKNWVISLTAVLADGTTIKTHHRPRKSAAGYDLTHLVIGSEGTLALVTEAVLRLTSMPRNLHVGIATFATLRQGVDVVVALQKSGHQLEMLELADGPQMYAVNRSGLARRRFDEVPTLFVKVAGPSERVVRDQVLAMESLARGHGASSCEFTSDAARIDVIWGARKCIGHALVAMKTRPTDLFVHSDCAVPISQLPALVEGTQRLISDANAVNGSPSAGKWFCANVGHVGDGNVHSSIVCPAEDKERAEAVLREVARLALRLEGTVTGEHGVGLKLRDALAEEVGVDGIQAMRRLKMAWDERGILNPDKVFRLDASMAKL
ncbi:FAD-binding domain-containing protein [Corynespora cassiicola Philippines]|uniref:FAD-binding domain-containing protein n=1 Tax=Corynespora cassiicola Philippines TaxID=1448308 RepID=A0A2T2N2G3_CORCC|nr:FAD-binding domain-containing protein [Corynespora cassiicola Philippines]